jgi:hypothetical protein
MLGPGAGGFGVAAVGFASLHMNTGITLTPFMKTRTVFTSFLLRLAI